MSDSDEKNNSAEIAHENEKVRANSPLCEEDDPERRKSFARSKKRKRIYDPEEEARLERSVFGDARDILSNLLCGEDESRQVNIPVNELEIKEEENKTDNNSSSSDSDDHDEKFPERHHHQIKKKAWIDEDDDYSLGKALNAQNRKLPGGRPEKKYRELLQNKFSQVHGTPKWAQIKKEKDDDSDDSESEVLKHSNHKVIVKNKKLSKGTIELKAVKDINMKTRSEGPLVTSVQFHPTSTVALVAGKSGVLSLFEVDGRQNSKLHSMLFRKFPISKACFTKDGNEIILGSMNYSHCFTYDLMTGNTRKFVLPHGITNMKRFEISPDGKYIAICGRLGEIYLLYSRTKELIHTFKMNKQCNALTFTPDGRRLITNGECHEIYVWDIGSRTCICRRIDDGCLSAASIAVSSSGQYLATGSKQGVVNVYETNTLLENSEPKPLKTMLNLTTSITSLKFNLSSEILAVASVKKPNAFKIMHMSSLSVFSNFPTFQTKIHNVLDIDFSPGSGFMSISNNKNHAFLYRLKHYGNY